VIELETLAASALHAAAAVSVPDEHPHVVRDRCTAGLIGKRCLLHQRDGSLYPPLLLSAAFEDEGKHLSRIEPLAFAVELILVEPPASLRRFVLADELRFVLT